MYKYSQQFVSIVLVVFHHAVLHIYVALFPLFTSLPAFYLIFFISSLSFLYLKLSMSMFMYSRHEA